MKAILTTTIELVAVIACLIAANGCGVSKITVTGQYGDYSFTPRKPIIIEQEK